MLWYLFGFWKLKEALDLKMANNVRLNKRMASTGKGSTLTAGINIYTFILYKPSVTLE